MENRAGAASLTRMHNTVPFPRKCDGGVIIPGQEHSSVSLTRVQISAFVIVTLVTGSDSLYMESEQPSSDSHVLDQKEETGKPFHFAEVRSKI